MNRKNKEKETGEIKERKILLGLGVIFLICSISSLAMAEKLYGNSKADEMPVFNTHIDDEGRVVKILNEIQINAANYPSVDSDVNVDNNPITLYELKF
ncbi:MAG: hypothetical protein P9M06_07895 [Candidatus Saelkia tenebricola]|nr:hypothetical protein [Candidatus Saelkia tenebricola]